MKDGYAALPVDGDSTSAFELDLLAVPEVEDIGTSLTPLAEYFLARRRERSAYYYAGQSFKLLLLSAAAVTSMLLYLNACLRWKDDPDHPQAIGWTEVVCTLTVVLGVTFNVCRDYANELEYELELSRNFPDIIDQSNKTSKYRALTLVVGLAAISALPFTLPLYIYYALPIALVLTPILLFDYSFIHTKPVNIILNNPYWRPLVMLPSNMYKLVRNCFISDETFERNLLQEQVLRDHQTLKDAIRSQMHAQRQAVMDRMPFQSESLCFHVSISPLLWCSQLSPVEQFNRILDFASPLNPKKIWDLISDNNLIYLGIGWLIWTFGVVLENISVSGFLKITFDVLYEFAQTVSRHIHDWHWADLPNYVDAIFAGTASALPIFITSVLLGYYGGALFFGMYDFAVKYIQNKHEWPLAFQLYTKSFLALAVLCAGFSAFSSSANEQVIVESFNGDFFETLKPYFVQVARYGIGFFGFASMYNIMKTALVAAGRNVGSAQVKKVVAFNDGMDGMDRGVQALDGPKLEESLSAPSISKEQRQAITGLQQHEFEELTDHERNLETYKASFWGSFWINARPSDQTREALTSWIPCCQPPRKQL